MSRPSSMPQSEFQKLVVEKALAYARHLEQAALSAPSGHFLDLCEGVANDQGRQFLLDTLAAALQQQIHEGEKKGLPRVPVLAATSAATRALTLARS